MPLLSRDLTVAESDSPISGFEKGGQHAVRDDRLDPRKRHPNDSTRGASASLPAGVDQTSSRDLSRVLAKQTSDKERKRLHEERAKLAWKEATGGLSPEEACRFGLVKWIVERIEDSEVGPDLDTLEKVAELIEAQAKNVAKFSAELRANGPPRLPVARRTYPSR